MRRLAFVALTVTALAALAACGSQPDPDNPGPGQTTAGGSGTLGEGVEESTTPTATASTGGGGSGGGLPAPQSSLPNKAGYAWVNQLAANYDALTAYQFNSAGGAIHVTHTGVGTYTVVFDGLGTEGGVAHAQAYGSTSAYCGVLGWNPAGTNQSVRVGCYAAAGAPTDSQFVVSFAEGSQGSSRYAYLWADQPSATAKYSPDATYRYDAVDSSKITVQRTAVGRYEVYLPTAGDLNKPWTFQVTAYDGNNQCKLHGFGNRKAQVACRTPGGGLIDSRFSLTFASGASIVGRTDRPYNAFSEDSDGLETPSTGRYVLRAPDLGQAKGQVVVVARGTSSTYCHVVSWNPVGDDLSVTIQCYNPGGSVASSSFEIAVTL